MHFTTVLATLLLLLSIASARALPPPLPPPPPPPLPPSRPPPPPGLLNNIITPQGITIRYREPGKEGLCETTKGVNSYSGYIDLDEDTHVFFWFFEARNDPEHAPITLWMNGGPGGDSIVGAFSGLGPCQIGKTNPYSWSEHSNLLFLSQPLGVGFSYASMVDGRLSEISEGEGLPPLLTGTGPPNGRYPLVDASKLDTSELVAVAAFHIVQGFLGALPQLDSRVESRVFNMWTISYGGHSGPAILNYFNTQNQLILNGTMPGIALDIGTLGIGNGLIDMAIQEPSMPEFAVNNTYGIKLVSDKVYEDMKLALNEDHGCLDQIKDCRRARDDVKENQSRESRTICSKALEQCWDRVEGPLYHNQENDRDASDIRKQHLSSSPGLSLNNNGMTAYMNSVAYTLGTEGDYVSINPEVMSAFIESGDHATSLLPEINTLLANGIRVHLFYGDADLKCNWVGGEAVSLAINYTDSDEFAATEYVPFVMTKQGKEGGKVRQYGNLSFMSVYNAGHGVGFTDQPEVAQEMFRRSISGLDIATGLSYEVGAEMRKRKKLEREKIDRQMAERENLQRLTMEIAGGTESETSPRI